MSGLLNSGLSAIGAGSALSSILFGDTGPVVLGDFTFDGLEVPASIKWGGAQRLNVHKMPGGARVIDAMGRDDMALSWSGMIMGGQRAERAYQLDEIRIAGLPVALSWGNHLYTVVVREFHPEDVAFQVKYRITCEVLRDESADPGDAPPTLLGQITDDINSALSIIGPVTELVGLGSAVAAGFTTAPTFSTAVSGLDASAETIQAQAVAAGPLTAGGVAAAALLASVAPVQLAATAIVTGTDAAVASTNLAGATTGNLLGTTDPNAAASALVTLAGQSGAAAGALAVRGMLGRIMDNLSGTPGATEAAATFAPTAPISQVVGGSTGTTATVIGGDLFSVAARQLGDATQWWRLAQASGMTDPMLSGINTLTIPDPIPAPSDGIPDVLGAVIL